MKKSIFIVLLIVLLPFFSAGDKTINQEIEILKQKLQKVEGRAKVDVLNDLAYVIYTQSPEKCIKYGNLALELSKKIKYPNGEASALRRVGVGYIYLGKYEKALRHIQDALDMFTKLGDKKGIGASLNNVGNVYYYLSNYNESLKYYLESKKIYDQIGNKSGVSDTLNCIGNIYYKLGIYDKALEYYMKSLELKEEAGDKKGTAYSLGNIGAIYYGLNNYKKALKYYSKSLTIKEEIGDKNGTAISLANIGNVYLQVREFKKAFEYYQESLKIFREIGDKRSIGQTLNLIGIVYKDMKKYDESLESFTSSMEMSKEIGDKNGISSALCNRGFLLGKMKKSDQALVDLEQGLKIAKEIKSQDLIQFSYRILSELHTEKGDYKKALEYHRLYSNIKDTIFSEKSRQRIAELEAQSDLLKKEKEIEILKQRNRIQKITRNAFIFSFILILIILILLFKKYLYFFSFWKKHKYIGQFRLLDVIGTGGMSVVYKAHSVRDKSEIFAIKVLKEEYFTNETMRNRFKQEATLIDKLNHPNIIKVIERGEYKGKLFITMEFLQGETLNVLIEREAPIDLELCFHVLIQVTDALVLIHSNNIIHRDLTPKNIMLIEKDGDPNFVKLLDFGIARKKFQTRLTKTGFAVGTVSYMSPEQISRSKLTQSSDIFSLGVIFYEVITGEKPFYGEDENEIFNKILNETPVEPVELRPEIPVQLNQIIKKMLDKDQKSRITSKEILKELLSIQQNL